MSEPTQIAALTSTEVPAVGTEPVKPRTMAEVEDDLAKAAADLESWLKGDYAAAKEAFDREWDSIRMSKIKLIEEIQVELNEAHLWLHNTVQKIKALF